VYIYDSTSLRYSYNEKCCRKNQTQVFYVQYFLGGKPCQLLPNGEKCYRPEQVTHDSITRHLSFAFGIIQRRNTDTKTHNIFEGNHHYVKLLCGTLYAHCLLALPEIETQFLSCPVRNLNSTPTALSWLTVIPYVDIIDLMF
jgi:hypothetical protein